MISGFIVDPDRKKMSKSRGAPVTPMPLVNQYGADAVRYWAANGRPGMDMAFDETVFTIGGKLVTKLYNAGKFVLMQEAESRRNHHRTRPSIRQRPPRHRPPSNRRLRTLRVRPSPPDHRDLLLGLLHRQLHRTRKTPRPIRNRPRRKSLSSSNPTPSPKHPPPTIRPLRPNNHRRSLVLDLRPRNQLQILNPPGVRDETLIPASHVIPRKPESRGAGNELSDVSGVCPGRVNGEAGGRVAPASGGNVRRTKGARASAAQRKTASGGCPTATN